MDAADLNPPQREAVEHGRGPLLILAGAGSGKTRVITHRIARLLADGIPAARILALTFTNRAADEMRARATALVGPRAAKVWVGTFHALGLALLKEDSRGRPFTVYDSADQLGVIREVLRSVKTDRRFDPKALLFRIGRWKNRMLSPEDVAARPELLRDEYDELGQLVYEKYEAALRGYAAYDFDDLLCEPVRRAREAWRTRWHHVLVDEYQDTNEVQLRLLLHLTGAGDVCVVGDDDQSIYGWRGAQASNILAFTRHFPGARIIKLEQNYRSRPAILDAANALIRKNSKRHEKRLWTSRAAGPPNRLVVALDADAEARFVATEIQALGARPGEVAVLYRSNLQSRPLEDALREAGIPYRVVSGQEFYERKEVKDVVAYLRAALFPRDEIALRRIVNYPQRGIGPAALLRAAASGATLRDGLGQVAPAFIAILNRLRERVTAGDVGGALRALVDEIGLYDDLRDAAATAAAAERRIGNVKDLIGSLERKEDLRGTLAALTLRAREEDDDQGEDEVTLATLHGSKGLEFPVVFLVGLEEGLLPHARTLNPIATDVLAEDAADLDEERRLVYVGITRARERLYLLRARTRTQRGRAAAVTPSRFLDEIPSELLVTEDHADDDAVAADCMAKLKALMAQG